MTGGSVWLLGRGRGGSNRMDVGQKRGEPALPLGAAHGGMKLEDSHPLSSHRLCKVQGARWRPAPFYTQGDGALGGFGLHTL